MNSKLRNVIALLCVLVMLVPTCVFASASRTGSASTSKITGTVMNYVWFGSYPQREVVAEASQSGAYGKDWGSSSAVTGDCYIVDVDLYGQLKEASWNSNGDTTIDGSKYHRINKQNATYYLDSGSHYNWSDKNTYHYFKYEPIKWRVLKQDGDNAFLMSDIALDARKYNTGYTGVTWDNCTLRSWLNGYDSSKNKRGDNYSNSGFINSAFSADERAAIEEVTVKNDDNIEYKTDGGNDTEDKVYLASESEVYTDSALNYGFSKDYTFDETREVKSSTYAKAMGVNTFRDTSSKNNCWWWLRTPGSSNYNAAYVSESGFVTQDGYNVNNGSHGIRPVLNLDLTHADVYTEETRDITVSAKDVRLEKTSYTYDGTEKRPKIDITGMTEGTHYSVIYVNNKNPGTASAVITGIGECSGTITMTFTISLPEQTGELTRDVNYDCVYFGSYPQAEIVSQASGSGAYGKTWALTGDYIVDSDLYDKLASAEWDANGDVTIGDNKYHRIKKSDSNFTWSDSTYYNWSAGNTTYHYFKYEPIKWRIIDRTGDDAFLVSDLALDAQLYNVSYVSVTWENCTLRSWLNGYGSSENVKGIDYSSNSFMDRAFTDAEQRAITTTTVINDDNISYETPGGNSTQDKVFLLSESEVYTDKAVVYGFDPDETKHDISRCAKSSTYAKAMGVCTNTGEGCLGNCWWWLRTQGTDNKHTVLTEMYGTVNNMGVESSDGYVGVRPAMHLNLKTMAPASAGETGKLKTLTVDRIDTEHDSYPYQGKEVTPEVTVSGLVEGRHYEVTYSGNTGVGTGTITVTGKGDWTGTITRSFAIFEPEQGTVSGTHELTKVEAKSATCCEEGNNEYWICSICKEAFKDAEGKQPTTVAAETIAKKAHTLKHIKNSAGYLKNGSEYDLCEECNGVFNKKVLRGYSKSFVKHLKVNKGQKSFTAKWKKQSKKAQKKFNGYQIKYSVKSSMSGAKTVKAGKSSRSKKVRGLKANKKYHVWVRTYTRTSNGTFFSAWSKKTVKTK